MVTSQSGLAEVRQNVTAPPDATLFRAGGVDYYLYMGAAEMRALQREWGVVTDASDSPDEHRRRTELYQARIDGYGVIEDDLTMIRIGLTRWHREASSGTRGVRALTNDDVAKTLEDIEPEPGDEGKAAFLQIGMLKIRFLRDMFGARKKAEAGAGDADPNAPSGQASSTQSSS